VIDRSTVSSCQMPLSAAVTNDVATEPSLARPAPFKRPSTSRVVSFSPHIVEGHVARIGDTSQTGGLHVPHASFMNIFCISSTG
jgi:hypothetical protein